MAKIYKILVIIMLVLLIVPIFMRMKPFFNNLQMSYYSKIDINEPGDFIYLRELLANNPAYGSSDWKPVFLMTHDLETGISRELLELKGTIEDIDYDPTYKLLAVQVEDEERHGGKYQPKMPVLYIYVIDLENKAIFKRIEYSTIIKISDGKIIYHNYKGNFIMNLCDDNYGLKKGREVELDLNNHVTGIADNILYKKTVNGNSNLLSYNPVSFEKETLYEGDFAWDGCVYISADNILLKDSFRERSAGSSRWEDYTEFYELNPLSRNLDMIAKVKSDCINPDMSSEGDKILYDNHTGKKVRYTYDRDIYLLNVEDGTVTDILNADDSMDYHPIWLN